MMSKKPTEEEKRETLFWDFIAAVSVLLGVFIFQYGSAVNWW